MSYFLGFDGGGTKTECAVLDSWGKVLGTGSAGPSNPLRVGFPKGQAALRAAAKAALRSAGLRRGKVKVVCAGLAGAGRPAIARRVQAVLKRLFPRASVSVVTDLEVALEVAAGAGPGLVLIAGTGSAAYGRNAAGATARAGGWGSWISDEGSAFDIGRRVLAAVARARDGLAPQSQLDARILAALKCRDWEELIGRVASEPHEVLPNVFPLVVEAATRGEALACETLSQAAEALARLASAVIRRLGMTAEEFVLAKVGGVFGQGAQLEEALDGLLRKLAPRARIERLGVSPAVGAARLALRMSQGVAHGGKG